MARFTFGAGSGDTVVQAPAPQAPVLRPILNAAATGTFWSAQTGGTQYTDLVDAVTGAAIPGLSTGQYGRVKQFKGPDGVMSGWIDFGAGRFFVAAYDGVFSASDNTTSGYIGTAGSATRTALDSRYQKKGGLFDPKADYGAKGDGTTDDTAAIQAAHDAAVAAGGGTVWFSTPGTYCTTGLLFSSNVRWLASAAGGQVGNTVKLKYIGASGGTLFSPKTRTSDTTNVRMEGIDLNGNALTAIVAEFYRTSYSRVQDCAVYGALASTGIGVVFDANVNNQAYFNIFDNVKVDGAPIGVIYRNGANANRWMGGKVGNGGTGMQFLSASSGNIIIGTDMESASVKHVYLDAGANVFVGLHMEVAPIGFDITANGAGWQIVNPTYASTVTTPKQDASNVGAGLGPITTDTYELKVGATSLQTKLLSTSTAVNMDPAPFSGTASVTVNLFRNITTTGTRQLNVYRANGTSDTGFAVDVNTRVITLGNTATTSAGGGQGVVAITNANVVPASTPAGGGVLYVEAGSLKFKGSSGTVTIIAPA